jgi:hypothetical protein
MRRVRMQVLWLVSVTCCCLRLSPHYATLHGPAFQAAWVLTLIGLTFVVKAHLVHQNLLQRLGRNRKLVVAAIGFLGVLLGAAGCALITMIRHSHQLQLHRAHVSASPQQHPLPTLTNIVKLLASLFPSQQAHVERGVSASDLAVLHGSNGSHGSHERHTQVVQIILALLCTVTASFSAHGASGYVLHHVAHTRTSTWAFYQPFRVRSPLLCTQNSVPMVHKCLVPTFWVHTRQAAMCTIEHHEWLGVLCSCALDDTLG